MAKQNVNQVKISDEDLEKIRLAVEQSRPKGYFESMRQQISPKEAMEFVKENPEVLKLLVLKKGGKVTDENYDMLRGKIKEVKDHASELQSITNRKKQVPAWVLAKSTRASTDLSDITHYMDSQKFSGGGGVDGNEGVKRYLGLFKLNSNFRGDLVYWKKGEIVKAYESNKTGIIFVLLADDNFQTYDEWEKSDFERIANPLSATLQQLLGVKVEPARFGKDNFKIYPNSTPDTDKYYDTDSAQSIQIAVKNGKFYFSTAGGYSRSIRPIAKMLNLEIRQTNTVDYEAVDTSLSLKLISVPILKKLVDIMQKGLKQESKAQSDFYKNSKYNSGTMSKGGGVESTSHIQGEIDDIRNWDNDEIANYIGVPISYVARDRNRYVREAQNYMMLNTFETGGNIGFKELSSRVSKSYQGKAVAPKYQSQYGKKYSKSEARDVGDKVAGKVYRQQQGRKFDSGGKIQHTEQEEDEYGYGSGKIYYVIGESNVGQLIYVYDLKSEISEQNPKKYKNEMYIDFVEVDSNHRGKGIATKLLEEAKKIAKNLGIEVITLRRDEGVATKRGSEYDRYLERIYGRVGFIDINKDEDSTSMFLETNKYSGGGGVDDLKVGDIVVEYRKDNKFENGYFEGKTRGLILRMDGAMAQLDFGKSQIYWIPIKDLKKADKYSGGGGVEEIKVGDIVGNTVQGFNFEVLDVEDGSQLKVKDVRTGRIFNTYFGNMYKSYTDKYSNGGKVRKMELYDAVLYNGKQYDISKKDGIVGLKNLSQGAYGSDYPFIPLSKININEVTDMYGNKVEISEIYMNGGNVGGLSDLMFG